ncbi:MAG: helix-turn-helix domain-containing protein [Pseudomonadota bacterium]|nr:helix-turn-helix domain-containing protein [Pseudomonadota bacterium]
MAKLGESIQPGTGNVFADLGFSDAGERQLKVQLAIRLNDLIRERGLTQGKAAKLFSVPQPHVSDLKNYKLNRFSSERLMYFMTLLDRDVEIIIRPTATGQEAGVVSVRVAQ